MSSQSLPEGVCVRRPTRHCLYIGEQPPNHQLHKRMARRVSLSLFRDDSARKPIRMISVGRLNYSGYKVKPFQNLKRIKVFAILRDLYSSVY